MIVNICPAIYVVGGRIGAGWAQSEIVSIVYTEQSACMVEYTQDMFIKSYVKPHSNKQIEII